MKHANSPKSRRAQRKRLFTCDESERRVRMSSRLSKELIQQFVFKSCPIQVGDVVEVTTGKFKGKSGKITETILKTMKVHVDGCTVNRSTGGTAFVPIDPSNLLIKQLNIDAARGEALATKTAIHAKTLEKYKKLSVKTQ